MVAGRVPVCEECQYVEYVCVCLFVCLSVLALCNKALAQIISIQTLDDSPTKYREVTFQAETYVMSHHCEPARVRVCVCAWRVCVRACMCVCVSECVTSITFIAELHREKTIVGFEFDRRGYSRQSEVGGAVTPAFPIVVEHIDPVISTTVDDDVNTERDEANNESRRPSGFSEIDFDLASFFAHTEVFRPKPGSKILQSKRRNVLLYSKIYNWRPKSVTYRNFFLPVIETRRSQDTPTNHIKY